MSVVCKRSDAARYTWKDNIWNADNHRCAEIVCVSTGLKNPSQQHRTRFDFDNGELAAAFNKDVRSVSETTNYRSWIIPPKSAIWYSRWFLG